MDLSALSDAELKALQEDAAREYGRRQIPRTMDRLNVEYLTGEGVAQGNPWRQPMGSHDAYPLGWQVTHNETHWQSLVSGNVWEPPTNWREISVAGHPTWVQPTGATDSYALGAIVLHLGAIWVSLVESNVWEPGVYGWDPYIEPEAEV